MRLSIYLRFQSEMRGRGGWRRCSGMFLLVRPSPVPSALIQRGDSCAPLPRVELIQKVSTNLSHRNKPHQQSAWGEVGTRDVCARSGVARLRLARCIFGFGAARRETCARGWIRPRGVGPDFMHDQEISGILKHALNLRRA